MKYKIILIISILLFSNCTQNMSMMNKSKPYNSKGFAYIYNDLDFTNKIISKKLESNSLQIGHDKLKSGTLVKIINPKTKKSLILKNSKKVKYPEFYKILITDVVADKLGLINSTPYVEVIEIKRNKSFVAEEAKIYKEEKKIFSNAPVELVKIDNISKNKTKKNHLNKDKMHIIIGDFYSNNSAILLKKRIIKELPNFDKKKLYINKKDNQNILLSGPYISVNSLKNDYIQLKKFGFEELDITINE